MLISFKVIWKSFDVSTPVKLIRLWENSRLEFVNVKLDNTKLFDSNSELFTPDSSIKPTFESSMYVSCIVYSS